MQAQEFKGKEVVVRKDFPFLLLRSDFFSKMFDSLVKNYGSAGLAMIFNMGKDQGAEKVKELMGGLKWFDSSRSELETLEQIFVKLNHMGWGKFNVESYDQFKKNLRIKVERSPFVDVISTGVNGGYSFLRGIIVGITSEIFEKEMSINDPTTLESHDGFYLFNVVNTRASELAD